ncbi:hypothetical protein DL89DRAFT_260710 [Linderina pennispora]|uniref:Uncharacterized protein n=1 Tax=Linderina pennispora TaxID=61395 RepID=A0A1Y1VX23_9FUNG|nr:uncharacterized protein DL89DRAFT_260710 [Linderina pennispora]ORX65858.1 hypothetical protein DL89DRAFT_260710 [Linderina pennispora]
MDEGQQQTSGRELASKEEILAEFDRFWTTIDNEMTSKDPGRNGQSPYILVNYQHHAIPRTDMNVDRVICYRPAPTYDLSSIHIPVICRPDTGLWGIPMDVSFEMLLVEARIWSHQQTRLFVPFMFLNGFNVEMVIINRSELMVTSNIGRFNSRPGPAPATAYSEYTKAMQRMPYFMNLPAEKFGHVCAYSHKPQGFKFTPQGDKFAMAAVDECCQGTFKMDGVSYFIGGTSRRLDHIIYGTFNGHQVVLKIAWVPANEPAVFAADAIAAPRVFQRGIIVKNYAGFRMEFIIFKDTSTTA